MAASLRLLRRSESGGARVEPGRSQSSSLRASAARDGGA
ncbi:hypothetical protein DB32_003366 [Sandaracinus amylolyticus]|uniref:Uncharacterized protein n=1 Tax=Sandaracinus amylolyticus TaxID=927083 RepID=A0A0F6W351_9BACT|nr:hypothetical protein DB32_003366 [Sandaracinus amylolyticus]